MKTLDYSIYYRTTDGPIHYLTTMEAADEAFVNWSQDLDEHGFAQAFKKRFQDAFQSVWEFDKYKREENDFETKERLPKRNSALKYIAELQDELIAKNKAKDVQIKAIADKLQLATEKACSLYVSEEIDKKFDELRASLLLVEKEYVGTRGNVLKINEKRVEELRNGKLREMILDSYFMTALAHANPLGTVK